MEAVGFGRSGGARSGTDGGARAGGFARSGTGELVEVSRAVPARCAALLRWRLPAPPHFFFFPDLLGKYVLEVP